MIGADQLIKFSGLQYKSDTKLVFETTSKIATVSDINELGNVGNDIFYSAAEGTPLSGSCNVIHVTVPVGSETYDRKLTYSLNGEFPTTIEDPPELVNIRFEWITTYLGSTGTGGSCIEQWSYRIALYIDDVLVQEVIDASIGMTEVDALSMGAYVNFLQTANEIPYFIANYYAEDISVTAS